MASDGRNSVTVAAINAAISSADHLYSPPEEERRWKVYWARYWCFKSQKREKRIVPAARSEGASGSAREWPTAQAGLGLVPPSSPASFVNSTVQSPASFALSLSAVSASMCSPGRPNTMFTIGPYAHETQLVSPPVLSTFTTEPSTAPFTPPPELAHLTTPSSPDVPFAQYIRSSLEAKRATRETISPLSTSNLASPCDTPVSYTPTSRQYYLGSPVGRLVSPSLDYSAGEVISYEKHFPNSSTYVRTVSSFPTYDPYASANFDGVPFAAFFLPSDTNSKCEEQPSSLLVQPDSVHEDGSSSLHKEDGDTIACEHSESSVHEEAGEQIVTEHNGSSLHKEDDETDVEFQVELDSRHDHVSSLSRMPLKVCDNYGQTENQDAHRVDNTCSGANANDCIRKGEKLQELLVHERNEMMLLQHPTDGECTSSPCYRMDLSKPCAKIGSKSSDGEPASGFEMFQDSLQRSVDPLQWPETRPIMFRLDDIPE
ncbi:hypothetical protein GOP47_0011745 [Adiantum capillus-veneris]|uniref:Uncharacterized protein n=1 Tax=Adiantum capillus-veneris TaxID=13818 RepID=A0A9D4ZH21_ADICA|nr:hypothetical protein GOP47_0011745 [Adiantum capillus-veneris]